MEWLAADLPFNQDIISVLNAQFPCVSLVEQFGDQTLIASMWTITEAFLRLLMNS